MVRGGDLSQLSWVGQRSHKANSSFLLIGCLTFRPSITNSQREGLGCPGLVAGQPADGPSIRVEPEACP